MVNYRHFLTAGLGVLVLVLAVLVWRQHVRLVALGGGGVVYATVAAKERADPSTSAGWWRALATGPARDGMQAAMAPRPDAAARAVADLWDDPRFVRALVAHQRLVLDERFGELFRQLDLNGEELETLRGLLVEKQNAALEVLMISRRQWAGSMGADEVRRASVSAGAEIEAMIARALGPERYARLQAFEATLPHRAAVAQLEQRLSYSDQPLRADQAEALVDILVAADATVRPAQPGVAVVVDAARSEALPVAAGTAPVSEISPEVMVLAAEVLEPGQWAVFERLQREQSAAGELVGLVRGAMPSTGWDTEVDPMPSPWGGIYLQLLLQ